MSSIIRYRVLLPSFLNITFNIQRCVEQEFRYTFYRANLIHQGVFNCRRIYSSRCGHNNNMVTDVCDSAPPPLMDQRDTKATDLCDSVPLQPEEQLDTKAITNGDPDMEKKLKVLLLEISIMRQEGMNVPQNIKVGHWKELIMLDTRSKRMRYLVFLWKTEMKKANSKQKKEEKKQIREEELKLVKSKVDEGHIQYGISQNTISLRIYDSTITEFDNYRLIRAMQFGQKLVVDCSYDVHMITRERRNCAKQLMLLFSENRFHQDPFNLYFCNVYRDGETMKELHKFIPTMYDDDFPLNITEGSYLDLFPKENIVYLTPHCHEELTKFDHDAIYIIGAMVDKKNQEPLSLAKAKKEGLRMAKLPLDRYLTWGSGSGKSLTLNQMIMILLDIRSTGDWNTALRHVPRRKIAEDGGEFHQRFYRKENFRKKFNMRNQTYMQ